MSTSLVARLEAMSSSEAEVNANANLATVREALSLLKDKADATQPLHDAKLTDEQLNILTIVGGMMGQNSDMTRRLCAAFGVHWSFPSGLNRGTQWLDHQKILVPASSPPVRVPEPTQPRDMLRASPPAPAASPIPLPPSQPVKQNAAPVRGGEDIDVPVAWTPTTPANSPGEVLEPFAQATMAGAAGQDVVHEVRAVDGAKAKTKSG